MEAVPAIRSSPHPPHLRHRRKTHLGCPGGLPRSCGGGICRRSLPFGASFGHLRSKSIAEGVSVRLAKELQNLRRSNVTKTNSAEGSALVWAKRRASATMKK